MIKLEGLKARRPHHVTQSISIHIFLVTRPLVLNHSFSGCACMWRTIRGGMTSILRRFSPLLCMKQAGSPFVTLAYPFRRQRLLRLKHVQCSNVYFRTCPLLPSGRTAVASWSLSIPQVLRTITTKGALLKITFWPSQERLSHLTL